MTSTTDTAGHPDVAEISDLTEGLLPPSRSTDVRQHLDGCELCADVYASLEEIRGLLGTLPGPPSMPADVAGRIDAALAAEALLHATTPDAVDAAAPVDMSSTRSRSDAEPDADDSAHVSRETAAAADRPVRPTSHARASTTGPGRKERKRGGRRRVAVLGTVFTVAALGFGSVLLSSLNDGKPSGPEGHGRQSASADTFSEGRLEKQVTDLLAKTAGGGSRAPHTLGTNSIPGSEAPHLFKQPTVPECVQKGISQGDAALATKAGRYQGTKALLVVLPDPSDGTRVTAYVMDATCMTDPSSGTAKVLLKQSYARS
ncbi:hypothetical protein AB0I77_24825 [Streptomyces sp. NPDC050619]|uniref:hypothetical protein n=1 Tax=Streptomyces sp. NPDC050619 TaxID=3157214 RepID=UPI00343D3579